MILKRKLRRLATYTAALTAFTICQNWAYAEPEVKDTPIAFEGFTFHAFADTLLSLDTTPFRPRTRQYLTQPTRDREGQINLAYIDANLDAEQWRGRLALQAGSSVDANYAAESEQGWRYVQEAVVGYKLTDKLWLDVGIYFSHIGAETWISRDNWSYTRLLASDFSPYYNSGGKITYEASEALTVQLHLINGWQNITDFDGRTALGTQVAYKFPNNGNLTYNTFLGKESEGVRFFNDIVAKAPPIGALDLAALFDIGMQERTLGGHDQWYTWALLSRYNVSGSFKLNARVEQFIDKSNVLVITPNNLPFRTLGLSFGFDQEIVQQLWFRTEYRVFIGEESVFGQEQMNNTDQFVVTSLSYTF